MPLGLGFFATAGGSAAATGFDLLQTTVLSSNPATFSFSGLGAYTNYKHLQVRLSLAVTTNSDTPLMRFNGVTGSSYAHHQFRGASDGNVYSVGFANQTYIQTIQNVQSTTNRFNPFIIDILDFSNTSKNTTVRYYTYEDDGSRILYFGSGLFNNTAAITSIDFTLPSRVYAAGSRFSLYGMA